MRRLFIALCILAGVLTTLVAPPALAGPVDQAGWNARKQQVTLRNGVRLAYVELGNPRGQPLLMLHGWTDSSRAWSILAPHLSSHRLLILDQRGHGASDKPACCYALSNLADDAVQFLDAKGIRRAAVVGHSLGSMVGQQIAAEHPDRVSKLVLMGSTALAPIKRGDWLHTQVSAFKAPPVLESEFLRAWSPAASPTPVDATFLKFADPETAAVPLQVWRGVMRELLDLPVGRFASEIKAPTLILSGGKDPIFTSEHHEALAKAIRHAEAHVFAPLGHNLNMERPEEVGPVLARFLAR